MIDKIKKTIKESNMLKKGDTIIVAVSGGIDSIVLLHVFTELAAEYKLFIIIAHLNHCLRGRESGRDEAFVKKLAESLGIKCHCKKKDISLIIKRGDSLQDVARNARYAFFDSIAKKYKADRIATGHNLDDQAETIVMRFINGAGLSGLRGIPKVNGKYIRPLIDISRKEIEGYAKACGLKFINDSSNKKIKYLRNDIRINLIPVLEQYNPSLKKDLARFSRIVDRDDEYLKDKAEIAYRKTLIEQDKHTVSMSVKKLNRLHSAIKARIFFIAVEELLGSSKGFYSYHVEDFLKLLCKDAPNLSINLPNEITVYKEYDIITIVRKQKEENRSQGKEQPIFFEKTLAINGKTNISTDNGFKIAEFKSEIQVRKGILPLPPPEGERIGVPLWRGIKGEDAFAPNLSIACFDYNKLQLPLLIRNFRPGDIFVPLGMNGHKKVKELFQEKKIARRKRGMIPIVLSGDNIIWAAGIRQAEFAKVDKDTKKILRVEVYSRNIE